MICFLFLLLCIYRAPSERNIMAEQLVLTIYACFC